MKKIMMAMLFFVLVMGACSNAPAEEDNNNTEENNNMENTENTENTENKDQPATNNDEENDTTDEATNIEKTEPKVEESEGVDNTNSTNSTNSNDNEGNKENQQSSDSEGEEATDNQSEENQLRELGYDIFQAQKEEDYAYLESILANSASMDQEANAFYFDDIAYPHELEFVQEEADNIEYRFIHEDDNDIITVGFGVVNYETETSYTIDFQFVKENGNWKMKDMDKNA